MTRGSMKRCPFIGGIENYRRTKKMNDKLNDLNDRKVFFYFFL